MKAAVFERYGPPEVLHIKEVPKPVPGDNEVLVRICAATASAGDCELRGSRFPLWLWLPARLWLGVLRPRKKVLGQDLSGEVEAVGTSVTRFKPGDLVMAATGFALGGYAEYACMPERPATGVLESKPQTMTHEEAACVPVAGLEAAHFLRKARIEPGERVLIVGAGGSIGTFAVQIAKHFGARVTAVDRPEKLDFLRSIGAEEALDLASQQSTALPESFDVILDVVGATSFGGAMRALKENGRYLLANPGLGHLLRKRFATRRGGRKAVTGAGKETREDLALLTRLVEAGALRSIIDKRFSLEAIGDAHRYVESGQKKGNVVIVRGNG